MLILVTNSWDGTTFELVEWCDYLALPYNKIDEVDIRELDMVLDANSLQVRFNGGPINHFNTRSDYVIYRRGKISWANQSKLTNGTIYIADGPDNYDLSEIFNFHGSETNRFTDNLISKIDGLKAAAVCQLHFPKTIISRDLKFVKQELGNRFIEMGIMLPQI